MMKNLIVGILLLSVLTSCNRHENQADLSQEPLKVMYGKGFTKPKDSLKPPVVRLCDTMPKPFEIPLPTSHGITFTEKVNGVEKVINLVPPVTEPYDFYANIQTFTSNDGLALDAIFCSCRDHFGNLWFGTDGGGISKFNGKTFTNYSMTEGLLYNSVGSITEDKQGNIWIGTYGGGVNKFDGKFFTKYTKGNGLKDNTVRGIYCDSKGNMWFGTYAGVTKFDGKTFTTYNSKDGLTNNLVLSIAEDKSGNMWFGTFGGGVSKFDPSAALKAGSHPFTSYTTKEGLVNNKVRAILVDNKGNIWLGTLGGGVSKFDGTSFTSYTTAQGLGGNDIRSIIQDKSGNIWFGTGAGGVSKFDGKSFTNITTSEGLSTNQVMTIVQDMTGNLWFGTFGGGVCRYDGEAFMSVTNAGELSHKTARCIEEDTAGNYWFGLEGGGVSKYDGKTFTNYTTEQGLCDNNLRCIMQDKEGNIWFGTEAGGVSKFNGKTFLNYNSTQGLPINSVYSMIEDKAGNIWLGSESGGVSKFDGKSFTNYTTSQGLPDNDIDCIFQDHSGNIWFGTDMGGVSKFDGHTFLNYDTTQGLPNEGILCIIEDSPGIFWFATNGGGVSRFDGKSFLTYTTLNGLSDNNVIQVKLTKEHTIALGTDAGITLLKGFTRNAERDSGTITLPPVNTLTNEELKNYQPVFEVYSSKTGYPVKDVNFSQNSMFVDSKGIIWMGTGSEKNSIVRFDYAALHKNKSPLNVAIQTVKVDNENISWNYLRSAKANTQNEKTKKDTSITSEVIVEEHTTFGKALSTSQRAEMKRKFADVEFDSIDRYFPVPGNLALPYNHNNITIDYTAIEPAKPYLVHYQYKLDGYDKDWSPLTTKTSATFGNMFEGTYVFELKAQSPYGVWSAPITYTFTVRPPWYRTWWAYTLYAIIFITLLILIIQWRTANLRKRQKELEQTIIEREKLTNDLVQRNKDLEQFAFIVSHNLRAPVANVIALSQEFNNPEIPQEDRMEMLGGLASVVNRLDEVVMDMNEVLYIKRQINEQKVKVNLSKLLADIKDQLKDLIKDVDVEIKDDFKPTDELYTIKSYIYSIFYNLISNSIKFRQKGKRTLIEIISTITPERVILTFKDNGMGIDTEENKEKLFELYRRFHRHVEGKGVGLFMTKVQIETLGGTISIASRVNEGTTFTVELPL